MGYRDGAVQVCDAKTGNLTAPVIRHPCRVDNVCYSPDDRLLLTVGHEDAESTLAGARLWDAQTGQAVGPFMGPANRGAVAHKNVRHQTRSSFSPDGTHVVAGYWGKVRQWDVSPDERPIADLVALAELLSTQHFDDQGNLSRFESPPEAMAERLMAQYAEDFQASPAQVAGWHEEQAERNGASEDSLPHHRAVIDLEPDVWWHYMQRGNVYKRLGRWQEAFSDFEMAVKKSPALGVAHIELSHAFLTFPDDSLRDTQKALAVAQSASALSPTDKRAWWQLARAQMANQSFQEALEAANHALEIFELAKDQPYWQYWLLRAEVLIAMGRMDDAADDLAQAVDAGPDDAPNHYRLALAQLVRGDTEAYRNNCDKMRKRFSADRIEDVRWTAWTCALAPDALDDLPQAAEQFEEVLSKSDDHRHLYPLGAILYRAGRYEDAVDQLNKAIDTWGDTPPTSSSPAYVWFFLAMAEQQLGHTDAAQKWLAKAVQQTEQELANDETFWNRRATLELLRDEASALLNIGE